MMYKFILPIIIISLLLACTSKEHAKQQEITSDLNEVVKKTPRFDWLLANWIRVDEEEGNTTYETWSKENDSTYVGWGYTLAAADTVFEEHMRFRKLADQWQLEVVSPGVDASTIFTMSHHTASSFTVENPIHDFPTKIEYFKAGDTLKADVSDDNMSIAFSFLEQ